MYTFLVHKKDEDSYFKLLTTTLSKEKNREAVDSIISNMRKDSLFEYIDCMEEQWGKRKPEELAIFCQITIDSNTSWKVAELDIRDMNPRNFVKVDLD